MVEIRVRGFFENRTFRKLLIVVPLKMYSIFDQPKWILVGQMLKLVEKQPMALTTISSIQGWTSIHTYNIGNNSNIHITYSNGRNKG